jgi:hypothetical protein
LNATPVGRGDGVGLGEPQGVKLADGNVGIFPVLRSPEAISSSAAVSPSRPSTMNMTASDSSTARSAWVEMARAMLSVSSVRPPVSTTT